MRECIIKISYLIYIMSGLARMYILKSIRNYSILKNLIPHFGKIGIFDENRISKIKKKTFYYISAYLSSSYLISSYGRNAVRLP